MKKGKYIDNYVIQACLSSKKQKNILSGISELLNKAFEASSKFDGSNESREPENENWLAGK
jgi:hypothetical protein